MTCAKFEEHIALDVGGDLPEKDRGALAEHLKTCASCRGLAAALAETQRTLGDLGRQPIDELAAMQVRRRVQASVAGAAEPAEAPRAPTAKASRQRNRWSAWGWAVAALLVLGLGLSFESLKTFRPDAPSTAAKLVVEPTSPWSNHGVDSSTPLSLANLEAPALDIEAKAPPPHVFVSSPSEPAPAPTQALQAAQEPQAHPEPMVIQLVSDDNSVVIHWLIAATS